MGIPKSAHPYQSGQPSDRLVYLLTSDPNFASHISQQIIHFGYSVQQVRDVKSLQNVIVEHNSVVVVVDIPSDYDHQKDNDIFNEIKEYQSATSTYIFVSERDDQSVRLKAIGAGGVAFFVKPINIVALVDKLDSLSRITTKSQVSRVLIVEDQPTVANYYQMILNSSGMEAQIVNNAGNVLEHARDFHPDLILMNTFLSGGNTTDLARIFRQIDEFVSIPIIFLSNEDDFGKRIEALDLGGDDFLIKPIRASQLMAVIRSRLERSKTLRSYMVRDSLTNLLNHTAFRNVLSQEVYRCKRQNAEMALAMLDIDHFKMVNDTFGHAAGDSALKGLSRLLKQRLRRSDIVGRYGGDEFVALLIDCGANKAMHILDEIRVHFAEIEFRPNEEKSISLTFSCGISTFPAYPSAESLSDSADQALYIAKAGQRNQIVVARP